MSHGPGANRKEGEVMQYGIYIDQNRCTGCMACVVACKDWHDVPAGPVSYIQLKTIEKGTYPDLFVAFLPTLCYHCKEPACVSVCPVEAVTKREEDGIVTVDQNICLGKEDCGQCLEACPYQAPCFFDGKAVICDLCYQRLRDKKGEGVKKTACEAVCPAGAIMVRRVID